MGNEEKICHGQMNGLIPCSEPLVFKKPYKVWWRTKLAVSHFVWHLKNKGIAGVLKHSFSKIFGGQSIHQGSESAANPGEEQLNLQPGEWVEVKEEKEILATLDEKGTYKGLRWMINMRKFCGKKFRVYKRLGKMLMENTGEYRKVKNTVLLEGVTCDGEDWFDCDRSCYHFWREIWLKRVTKV